MSLRSINDNSVIEFIIFYIYLFHMPLFMCLSGLLYLKTKKDFSWENYKSFEFKKILNLLVPYFTFYIIFMTLNTLFSNSVNNVQGIKGWLGIINDPVAPYWFLYALLSIFLVIPIVEKICKNNNKLVFVILLILKIISIFVNTKMYFIDSIMKWGVYFYFGYFIRLEKNEGKNARLLSIISSLFMLLFSLLLYEYKASLNSNLIEIIKILFAFLGIIVIINFFKTIVSSKILNTYKDYTFQIFLTHTIFAAGFRIILFKLGIKSYIIHFFIGIIISIYVPIIMSKISEKIRYTEFFFYPVKTIKLLSKKK